MVRISAIDSLTNFQKNAKQFVTHLEETGEPMILTVNGQAKVVLLDAKSYEALMDEVEETRFAAAVREGIRQYEAGNTQLAREALKDLRAKYDV